MEMRARGIFLLEFVFVVGILSLLVTICLPRMDFIRRAYARAEIDKLYSDFIYLQQCSVSENKIQTLSFDEKHNEYSYNGHSHSLPRGIVFGVLPGVLGPPSKPSKPIEKGITFKDLKVMFYPTGIVRPGMVSIVDYFAGVMFSLSSSASSISSIKKYAYQHGWIELK